MTDLHSHILYGIDDGARSLEESRRMLLQARKVGYRRIVSTRHYPNNQFRGDGEVFSISQRLEILKSEADALGMEVLRGAEVMISPETLREIEAGQVDPLGGSRTVLIEFQIGSIERSGLESVRRIVEAGYVPLIAHVERYRWKTETLAELKKLGGILQMNVRAAALGKDQWREWLTSGLIDVLATDAHRAEGRSYELAEEIATLKSLLGEERFKVLTETNPERLLAGEKLIYWEGENSQRSEVSLIKKLLRFIGMGKR